MKQEWWWYETWYHKPIANIHYHPSFFSTSAILPGSSHLYRPEQPGPAKRGQKSDRRPSPLLVHFRVYIYIYLQFLIFILFFYFLVVRIKIAPRNLDSPEAIFWFLYQLFVLSCGRMYLFSHFNIYFLGLF